MGKVSFIYHLDVFVFQVSHHYRNNLEKKSPLHSKGKVSLYCQPCKRYDLFEITTLGTDVL